MCALRQSVRSPRVAFAVRRSAGENLPVAKLAKSFGNHPKVSATSATVGMISSAARLTCLGIVSGCAVWIGLASLYVWDARLSDTGLTAGAPVAGKPCADVNGRAER